MIKSRNSGSAIRGALWVWLGVAVVARFFDSELSLRITSAVAEAMCLLALAWVVINGDWNRKRRIMEPPAPRPKEEK